MQKSTIQWNCKQIAKMVENGSLVFDNAIQRGFVWDKKRMVKLIDSILRGYPIPPFYTVKDGRTIKTPKGNVSVYDCFEGKQRSLTITKFKNDEFPLTGVDAFVLDNGDTYDVNDKTYSELPDELKDIFDSYSLTVYFFMDTDEDEISEIMSRLNNGKPLSVVENTRIKAVDLSGIQALANHPFLTNTLSEKEINGYVNEDIVVKTVALLKNKGACLDNAVIRPLFCALEITPQLKNDITSLFDYMSDTYKDLAEVSKKAYNRAKKRTHLLSLVNMMSIAKKDKRTSRDMATMLSQFFSGDPTDNEDYNAAVQNGVNHADNVLTRNEAVMSEYNWYFNGKNTN